MVVVYGVVSMGDTQRQKEGCPNPNLIIFWCPQSHELYGVLIFFMLTIVFTSFCGFSELEECKIKTVHAFVDTEKLCSGVWVPLFFVCEHDPMYDSVLNMCSPVLRDSPAAHLPPTLHHTAMVIK